MTSAEVGTETNQLCTHCIEYMDNMSNQSSDTADILCMNSESGKVTEEISTQTDNIEVTSMDFGCEVSGTAIDNMRTLKITSLRTNCSKHRV